MNSALPTTLLVLPLLIFSWVSTANAGEPQEKMNLMVLDREIVVDGGTPHWPCAEGLPDDWTDPVDYTGGRLHILWEILEAPEDAADFRLQIGWTFPEGSQEGKDYQLVRFKYQHLLWSDRFAVPENELPESGEPETPYWIAGKRSHTVHVMGSGRFFWPLPEKEPKDFSRGITGIKAFARDDAWQVRGPSAPVRMRVTMVLVPEGGTWRSPTAYGGLTPKAIPDLPEVAAALRDRDPGRALARAEAIVDGGDASGVAREQAEAAVAALGRHVDAERAACEELFAEDPLAAFERLAALTEAFADTSRHEGLRALGKEWSGSERVAEARRAGAIADAALAALARIEADLGDPDARKPHAREIRRIAAAYRRLVRRHEESVARARLERELVARGLLVPVEDGDDDG